MQTAGLITDGRGSDSLSEVAQKQSRAGDAFHAAVVIWPWQISGYSDWEKLKPPWFLDMGICPFFPALPGYSLFFQHAVLFAAAVTDAPVYQTLVNKGTCDYLCGKAELSLPIDATERRMAVNDFSSFLTAEFGELGSEAAEKELLIGAEGSLKRKSALPSFKLPSLTPKEKGIAVAGVIGLLYPQRVIQERIAFFPGRFPLDSIRSIF